MLVFWVYFVLTAALCTGNYYEPCSRQFEKRNTLVTCRGQNVTKVPQDLPTNATKMSMTGTGIRIVQKGSFSRYKNLTELFFRHSNTDPCRVEYFEPGVFDGLDQLEAIGVIGCESLHSLEQGVLGRFKRLKILQIYRSGLTSVPDMSMLKAENADVDGLMEVIDLHNNKIDVLHSKSFPGIIVTAVNLAGNLLTRVEHYAFKNSTIASLKLNNNPSLTTVEDEAFADIRNLIELDLSRTSITTLPTTGLSELKTLLLQYTPQLKQFPSVLDFSHIEKAELYYPHHCCAFKNPEKQNPALWKRKQFQQRINEKCSNANNPSTTSKLLVQVTPDFNTDNGAAPVWDRYKRQAFNDSYIDQDGPGSVAAGFNFDGTLGPPPSSGDADQNIQDGFLPDSVDNGNKTQSVRCGEIFIYNMNITCTPEPDAFNPCEDVMGYEWLRVIVWFVLLAALLGNFIVFTVLVTSRGKITVPKFLMCNLAFADFLMGVYLIILASMDIHTLGEYFNYAVLWQNEGGCQVAGFLTVFSSELSIFTLTIITLERWYAIRYAIHLNKRIKLRHSLVLMTLGYAFAIVMALLPLVGISGYGNVSICLPMKVEDSVDVAYVVSILILNGLLFLVICFCYVSMYWKVKGSDSTARSNDATIAKRMALLVFTNFACWAPIAFFGLTASAGAPLIDITNSKILVVFFYPLNSCADPFLYAILTKQFRKDVFILLGKHGICVAKANTYRGTFTSRSMSQSRAGKDMTLHNMCHNNDSSPCSHLTDSNNCSKISISSTPKIHPSTKCSESAFHVCRGHVSGSQDGPVSSQWTGNNGTRNTCYKERQCRPYVRSVSGYMALGSCKGNCTKRPAPKHQVSTETYISNSTDTTFISDSSHCAAPEDIWQIREESEEREMRGSEHSSEEPQGKPFTCDIYSDENEMRISHRNCYTVIRDCDFDDDDVFQRFLSEDDSTDKTSGGPDKFHATDNNISKRYKLTKSPSLSSLDEGVEQSFLPHSQYCECGSHVCDDSGLKADRSKESGFHSSVSLQGTPSQEPS